MKSSQKNKWRVSASITDLSGAVKTSLIADELKTLGSTGGQCRER